jgi:predicted outer membrane protein
VPTSLIYEDEQMVKQGSEKSAAEFDAWYAQQMMSEIHKAIALFESASKMPDAKLAAFAKKTLPTLQDRQRLASDLTQGASQ